MDRLLDRAVSGPLYLGRPEIAELVVESLKDGIADFSDTSYRHLS